MSEPLKGGFASFSAINAFKPPGTTGAAPSTGLFGNNSAPAATNAPAAGASSGTPSAFGSGGGNMFGGFGAKPTTGGSLFGGGGAAATPAAAGPTPSPAAGSSGSNLFGGLGAGTTPGTQSPAPGATGSTPAPVPASNPTSAFGGGLFGAKPADASSTPAAPKPTSAFAGFGNTPASQPASTTASTTPSLFSKPAEVGASSATPAAPASGSVFGAGSGLFGKKPDAPASSSTPSATATPAAPSLFGGIGAKKDDNVDKDKDKAAAPAVPAGGLFGQPAANKDAPAAATGSTFNLFGQKPAEKKDTPAEGEKKDVAAAAPALSASALGKPASTSSPAPIGISVPPPSMLRGKTIEEIVNKWSSELETHVREFDRLAGEVAVWDRALIDNGNTIAALFQHVLLAEREQSDIEQSLKHVEDQQKELASTLDIYEKAAGEIFDGQGGGLRALDVGPADAERDKHYTLAADLNTNIDDLSRSLMQMIDSVNTLSGDSDAASGGDDGSKGTAPLEQIAQILSSHLEGLQWIDGAVREVDSKVTDVERLVRDASSNGSRSGSTTNSMAGSVNGSMGMSRSRGFGVR